jgi:hypothetical protein
MPKHRAQLMSWRERSSQDFSAKMRAQTLRGQKEDGGGTSCDVDDMDAPARHNAPMPLSLDEAIFEHCVTTGS